MRRLQTGTLSVSTGHIDNKVFFSFFILSIISKYETPAILKKFESIFQRNLPENMNKDNFI